MERIKKVKEDLVEKTIIKTKKRISPKQVTEPEAQLEVEVENKKEEIIKPVETTLVSTVEVNPVPGKIRWKNFSGKTQRNIISGKIIKPGEIFTAYPDQISLAFRDVIIALSPIPDESEKPVIPANITRMVYTLKPAEKEGFFDIYNGKDKKMNEIPLEESTAKQLIKDLQS
jgi:hypothetical protein